MPFSSSRIVKAAFHDMPLCLHNYTGFCFYASSLAWLTFYIKVIFGHNLAITYLNFKLSWIYFQLFNHPKEPNTQMRACARTHTHTPCPCFFLLRTVNSLMFCFPVAPFLSLESVLLRLLSPHAGSRGSDSPPSYHWLSTQLLGTASCWPSLSSSLLYSLPFHLNSLTPFFPAHFLMSRPCWRAVLVQFCTNCAGSPKPMCVLLIFAVNKLESNLTKN